MTKRLVFRVELDQPPGCSVAELRDYIEEEIKAAIGGKHPYDPVTNLDRGSVKVRREHKKSCLK